ncbi:MAG: LytTR family transcriptional regulator DNA-binding domain-containing protein [Clostridia bacterium]|nr:LytTR family transcriptional regulator DNA-binding domain-containing protein [Clostridia bacterium]
MKNPVHVEIQIDPKCHDPVILIRTDQKTPLVEDIVHAIESCMENSYPLIAGYRNSEMELLSQRDIIRVYVEARKVRICTGEGVYDSRKTLAWLETVLNPDRFVRISRFEIVNIRKIARFDFNIAGTVQIVFDDGSVTWAARRHVRAIQQALRCLEAGREE